MPDTRLIERWLPIVEIGIESTCERTPITPFPGRTASTSEFRCCRSWSASASGAARTRGWSGGGASTSTT